MSTLKISYNPIKKPMYAFEYTERGNNTVIIGVEVVKKKGELDIARNFIVDDSKDLQDYSSASAHLVITDNQVLTKEITIQGTDQEIVSEAYPNLDVADFYFQILKTSEKSFISICRKKYVDDIISLFSKAKISITNVDLGNLKASAFIPLIKETELLTYSGSLHSNNEELSSITSNGERTERYSIDSIEIPSTHVLSFSSILYKITGLTNISGNLLEKNIELVKEYKESQFFKKTLQYGIGFLLFALLINFFIFNSNYKKLQELQAEEQVYTTQKESIKKQQGIVNTKEGIVKSILATGFSKSSFYADQIIKSQPLSVLLKSLNYQPILKTIRNDKPITIQENVIVVTGDSLDKTSFTNWIHNIEDLDFVENVTILSYGIQKRETAVFEIEIKLVDDTKE